MPAVKFSMFWEVAVADQYIGTAAEQRTKNDLDAHGTFLDLPRLPREEGVSYIKRLRSVIPLRGGSDQAGLVHGITRELGLDEKVGMKITPIASGSVWLAPSPHVEVTATTLTLYSEYYNEDNYTVDRTIDIFDQGSGYLMGDLVNQVQLSQYFVAELGPYMTGDEKSNGLIQDSSAVVIEKEWVPGNSYFFLENTDVIETSLFFTEKAVFTTEVASADLVVAEGDYYVDYPSATVTSYGSASGRSTCRYVYRDFPWRIKWSPVTVYSLRDDNYREKLFESEYMLDGSTRQGVVSDEGSQVYSQVFDRATSLWGR